MTITIELKDEETAQLVIDALSVGQINYPFSFFSVRFLGELIAEIREKGEKEGWDLTDGSEEYSDLDDEWE